MTYFLVRPAAIAAAVLCCIIAPSTARAADGSQPAASSRCAEGTDDDLPGTQDVPPTEPDGAGAPEGEPVRDPEGATERVQVTEEHPGDADAPTGMASTLVDPAATPGLAEGVAGLAASVAGVSENGQGGLFQSVSIRGRARQRILQLVDGMRITDDRRAGPATSFLDPGLVGSLDVLRGPGSAYYGSGALGGVLQVFPRWFDGAGASAGYLSQGDGSVLQASWGNDNLSFGAARRAVGDGETAEGAERFSGFRQVSATLAGRWSDPRRSYRLLWIPSVARDIHKPNTDFPGRRTTYPEEEHHLIRFAVEAGERWEASAWLHPHSLDTEVIEDDGSSAQVANDSLDFGARWLREQHPGRLTIRWGFDTFHRRGVDALETQIDPSGARVTQRTLADAADDEIGGFAAVRGHWGEARWEGGLRWIWLGQRNDATADRGDDAGSGFFGATVPLAGRLHFRGHAGTGLRFPTLTERFFSGTTGRGVVVGNADLDPERSYSLEAGLQWLGDRVVASGSLFHDRIDEFIERIEIAPGILTFANLDSGTIRGVEAEATWSLARGWQVSGGGAVLEGRDGDDEPLADIPAAEVHVGGGLERPRWGFGARIERRAAKDDPGSGEKEIGAATLLAASAHVRLAAAWSLEVRADNLLDQSYFPSADRLAQEAASRSYAAVIRWSLPAPARAGAAPRD